MENKLKQNKVINTISTLMNIENHMSGNLNFEERRNMFFLK